MKRHTALLTIAALTLSLTVLGTGTHEPAAAAENEPWVVRQIEGDYADASTLDYESATGSVALLGSGATVASVSVSKPGIAQAQLATAAYDMASLDQLGLGTILDVTVAPTGDPTDDPDATNVYVLASSDGSDARLYEVATSLPALPMAVTQATWVQTIDTSGWPSPDPTGIIPLNSGNFAIVDSEVEEARTPYGAPEIFTGYNVFEMAPAGTLGLTGTTTSVAPAPAPPPTKFSDEPSGIGYNPGNGHVFIVDDEKQRVFELDPGADGFPGTADDGARTSFKTNTFGSTDPEGVEFDQGTGDLFILDGLGKEIYRVSPGTNGIFDGIPADGGDDVVTQFDVEPWASAPEGLGIDKARGILLITDRPTDTVSEVSRDGTLLRLIEVKNPIGNPTLNPLFISGVTLAPGSLAAGPNLWITDRGWDNDLVDHYDENDGKVYEFSYPATTVTPSVSVTATDPNAAEAGSDPATFTFRRSGDGATAGVEFGLTVNYTITGTAVAGDYTPTLSGTVSIPAGKTTGTVTITPVNDTISESAETVILTVAAGSGYVVGSPASATATIVDNDPTVSIAATDATATEASGNTATFTITRSGPTTGSLAVKIGTSGTATSETDYTALPGTATIASGQSSVAVVVTPIQDSTVEGDETVIVTVQTNAAYVVAAPPNNSATATITDSPTTVTIVASDPTATESYNNGGTFTISRTGATTGSLSVTYTTTGTASPGSDYAALSGTAVIPSGQASVIVAVAPTLDLTVEGNETVIATVQAGSGYVPGTPKAATVTIIDLVVISDRFIDDDDSIFEGAIDKLAAIGVTQGCNPTLNTKYCPTASVTRGEMAAFIVRALNLTDQDPSIDFIDDNSSVFENAIEKLATAGITKGCNKAGDKFCPDDPITRGEMAAFLVRAFGYTDNGGGDLFTDDDTSIFENAIDKLATAGVTKGCNVAGDQFCPNDLVTREQMAAFIIRAFGF